MSGRIILDRVDFTNDLGVLMDSKVPFTGQIDVTVGFGNAWVCEEVVVSVVCRRIS
jgi:hypothetical protein